jgi:hypothetical protein
VFTRYNKLFARPSIRSAVSQYQADILIQVTSAVESLRKKLSQGYQGSDAERLHKMRDVPPISGHIGWAMKIRAQLHKLQGQLASVMGEQWAQLAGTEGQKLSEQMNKLTKSLDPNAYFQEWVKDCRIRYDDERASDLILVLREDPSIAAELKRRNSSSSSSSKSSSSANAAAAVVDVLGGPRLPTSALSLEVNFDEHALSVMKEVRNLTWLGFTIPNRIREQADLAELRYPSAVALRGALRTYNQAILRIPLGNNNGHEMNNGSIISNGDIKKGIVKMKGNTAVPSSRPLLRACIARFRACVVRSFSNSASASAAAASSSSLALSWNTLKIDRKTFDDWVSDFTDSALKLEQSVEELEVTILFSLFKYFCAFFGKLFNALCCSQKKEEKKDYMR